MVPAHVAAMQQRMAGQGFRKVVAGRRLVMDGDGLCYRVAATVKRLDTAIRHFQQGVLQQIFLAKCEDATVHLTSRDSLKVNRADVLAAKPYQGQRSNKAKPALLEPLREAMAKPENWLPDFNVEMHRWLEADDGIIMQAHILGDKSVVYSEDKDLRMTRAPYYDIKTGEVLTLEADGWFDVAYTDGGTIKPVGHGPLFFWGQMLCGDTADNIQGIPRMGPAAAKFILDGVHCEHIAANLVLDEYRKRELNPVTESYLLWLWRWENDSGPSYIQSLKLSAENLAYFYACCYLPFFKEIHNVDTDD